MRSVVIDWDREFAVCRNCDGTGCGLCSGLGEHVGDLYVHHVTCACGWECDGHQLKERSPEGLCPECGTDIDSAIAAELPNEEDGQFRDYDQYDLDDRR